MVTAEAALALIGITSVLVTCCAGIQVMVGQLRTQEAVRVAAREIARGATQGEAEQAAAAALGAPVLVILQERGSLTEVEVSRVMSPSVPRAPRFTLRARAVTASEAQSGEQ